MPRPASEKGFSFVEIVAVLGIITFLAAVLIPVLLHDGGEETRTLLEFNLHALESRIAGYCREHSDQRPAIVAGTLPQLIHATNRAGDVGECGPDFPYGPYLGEGIPKNPCDGSRAITAVEKPGTDPIGPVGGLGGWLYDASNGKIYPNDATGLRLLGYTR